ncbi:MAG: glycosyltransferase family 2 protein [Casimicrobiaceae bacterium]
MAAHSPAGKTDVETVAAPAFTVVLSTYNRSNILPFAIETVRWQTGADWELLVIGDACTDDSEEVVARFADPRIRFINLRERVGDQSGPNNEGVRQARGRLVAFLNHDDLWFPDHLERMLPAFADDAVDMAFAMPLEVEAGGRFRVNMVYPDGEYDPRGAPPIPSWVVRRSAFERFGPMRRRDECWSLPTQDWLFRAWKRGARVVHVAAPTLIVITSTTRRDTYRDRHEHEQRHWFDAMRDDPGLRERALVESLSHPQPTHLRMLRGGVLWKALGMRALARIALALGGEPEAVYFYLNYPKRWGFLPRRGAVFAELYRRRGLSAWKDK